jgi:DNA-binding response OmpR family regulator
MEEGARSRGNGHGLVQHVLGLGARAYLNKPVSLAKLLETAAALLGEKERA